MSVPVSKPVSMPVSKPVSKPVPRSRRLAVLLATAAAAAIGAGCGGGGGGTSEAPSGGLNTVGSPLNPGNYVVAAREGVNAGEVLVDTGSAAAVLGAEVSDAGLALRVARDQVLGIGRRFAGASQAVSGALITSFEACSDGGRVDFTIDDTNSNGRIDAGESIELLFTGCVETGASINGGMRIVATSANYASATAFTLAAEVQLTNFSVSTSTGSGLLTGAMRVAQSQTATDNFDLSIGATDLASQVTYAGVTTTRRYATFQTVDNVRPTASGISETITHLGTLFSSVLGDRPIAVTTVSSLVRRDPDRFPSSGQLIVSGANGSKVRITALSATQVRVELDSEGDGTYELTTERPWTDLG